MDDGFQTHFGGGVADASRAWDFVESLGLRSFKEWRNLGLRYLEGAIEPPSGYALEDVVYALMLRSADAGDVTAHWYIGLWYLEEGENGGPFLPLAEGETPLSMAIMWLEAGRRRCDHGTILRTREALQRLAWVYEFDEGNIPDSRERALDVYMQMAGDRFWPECDEYQNALYRLSGGEMR